MNIKTYLKRIGFTGDITPSTRLLHQLHQLHVGAIAFENSNPYIGVRVTLSLDELYERIVKQHRGGGCYELNGLFYDLLVKLGFTATLVPAKLYKGSGVDNESLHAVIEVALDGKTWYVDPGYGEDGIVYPLEMTLNSVQRQNGVFYRFTELNGNIIFSRSKTAKRWQDLLLIEQTPVTLSYFDDRALYHQTSPNSWFKNNFTCSLLSESEQKTLLNTTFTHTSKSKKTRICLKTAGEFFDVLVNIFGVQLPRKTADAIFLKATQ